MFNAARILVSTLVVGMSVCVLGGCGQTGALYLPPAAESAKLAPKPAQVPETQETVPSISE